MVFVVFVFLSLFPPFDLYKDFLPSPRSLGVLVWLRLLYGRDGHFMYLTLYVYFGSSGSARDGSTTSRANRIKEAPVRLVHFECMGGFRVDGIGDRVAFRCGA